MMLKRLLPALLTLTLTAITQAGPQPQAVPGGVMLLPLPASAEPPVLHFNQQRVMVIPARAGHGWQALVGIPLSQTPGPALVSDGSSGLSFEVQAHAYPEQHLTVSNKHVFPSDAELQRIRQEQQQMAAVYRHYSPARPWPGMQWPLRGPQSSAFGLRRFFNGEERNPHSGLDIAAPTGAAVYAPAPGKVVLTGDFFFNGQTVFIDHGQGLISMLCHLSRIDVTSGHELQAGELIGAVGATGRATGPHLHWTVSLNNARINPRLLLASGQPPQPDQP